MTSTTEYEKIQQPWTLLQSKDEVKQQVAQHKDKIVVILFNLSSVNRNSVEHIIRGKRHKCSNSAVFFKCIVEEDTDELPSALNVKQVPTILFYRNGEEEPYHRLTKPTADEVLTEMDKLEDKKN